MKKSILFLSVILLVYVFLYWFNLNYVLTFENISVLYEDMIDGNEDVAKTLYDSTHKYWIAGVFIAIISSLFKILFYSLVVYLGYYIIDKQKFTPIFQAVVGAEFVNIIMAIVKNVNLAFVNPPESLLNISVIPFSLMSFFNENVLDQWMVVPLSAANIFEVAYIVLLSLLLSKKLQKPFSNSCKTVLLSYGLVTLLYIVGTTFFSMYATK